MQSRSSGYQNLDNVYQERDSVPVSKRHWTSAVGYMNNGITDDEIQWYWRLISIASAWMILGG